jgi:hypothetical protein
MTLADAVVALIVLGVLGLIGTVYRAGNAVDLGAAFRNLGLARAARKLGRTGSYPDVIERTYWSAPDYVRDSQRLKALGYSIATQSITGPHIGRHVPGRGGGRNIKRRVPLCRVTYDRRP